MQNISQLSKVIKDYVFPRFCLGCNLEGHLICKNCSEQIQKHESTEFFNLKKFGVKILFSALLYDELTLAGRAYKVFKYDLIEEMFTFFVPIIQSYFSERASYFDNIDMIIPIPLHPRRYAERGFNQSVMIAKVIGDVLQKDVLNDAIYRVRYTKNQARLDKVEREENIRDAFELNSKYNFKNKKILLVDDIFTTGATVHECGGLFAKSGVAGVYAFTLFKGN